MVPTLAGLPSIGDSGYARRDEQSSRGAAGDLETDDLSADLAPASRRQAKERDAPAFDRSAPSRQRSKRDRVAVLRNALRTFLSSVVRAPLTDQQSCARTLGQLLAWTPAKHFDFRLLDAD